MTNPYAPPTSDDVAGVADRSKRAPVRLAGLLFLLSAALAGSEWLAEFYWGMRPSRSAILEALLQACLGAGLVRFGPNFVRLTLVVLCVAAIYQIALHVPAVRYLGARALIIPVIVNARNFLTPGLLLIGKPAPLRRSVAVFAFAASSLLNLTLLGLAISVRQPV